MAQFRTKARAVDLLGKGQIADLPTAVTELWKNGYDAYADNLKAEIYLEKFKELSRPYFVISDDGKGMSRKDILDKWLVLGTDSKSRAKLEAQESEETLWKQPRIKAGEKGIGRLSVAYLGHPMLMLTKKIGHPLQAMFFDWRLLENFNLFLDDIIIPIKEILNINDFQNVFKKLKQEFLKNFDKEANSDGIAVWEDAQFELKDEILASVENAVLEGFFVIDLLSNLIDIENHHGTKFFIFEPIPQITQLTEKDEDYQTDIEFVISSLSGFTNPFKEIATKVNTEFPIHIDKGYDYDLLTSKGNFFTKEDYDLADVLIDGEFDGSGSFSGNIRIYDEVIEYSYTNPRKKDRKSFYGSIPIKLGYSQGEEKSSQLDENSFKKLGEKIKSYGGLYIYRDNFRVLPYGRPNADFLGFEERRSKRFAYYFSYRRMYGFLGISRGENPNLKDKSSREGLINNAQYRAFVNDVTNFFIELAKEYFASDAEKSLFLDKKKELNERFESMRVDKEREKSEKIAFTKSLNEYPDKLKSYQTEYEELLGKLEEKLNQINIGYSEIENILSRINELDAEYNKLLPKIPKRYSPTETQLDRLDKYSVQLEVFNNKLSSLKNPLFDKAQEKLEIRDLKKNFSKKISTYNAELERNINEYKTILVNSTNVLSTEYNQRAKRILSEFNNDKEDLIAKIDTKEKVSAYTHLIESRFDKLLEEINKTLYPLVNHIKNIRFDLDEELIQGAYKAEYENMKYQWEQIRETAQLGIAVEIIDHEFNQLYAKINQSINRLNSENLFESSEEFEYLTKNFKQLENKYELLSPLYRISGATVKDISGEQIYDYLNKFFENPIKDYVIELTPTESFLNHIISIKEPVLHTVFINIINNAIYWLRNSIQRIIKLDYFEDTNEFLILNSGQRIEEHRLEKIFQLFYSNRPNGRGIGLYLTKQSLNESGFDIYATNDKSYNTLEGACFVIKLNP
ncbi:MAG: ATP-binding protein [Dysgonamonadaceae bacterium]|jgi:signal transduction histidine kinase|nr:ATP-binding protein [Dysgonamonadaceae bacterium]